MSVVFRRMLSSTPAAFAQRSVFVGNLAWTSKPEDISSLFSQYGKVDGVRIMTDRETGRSRGFGFVEMEEADAVSAAEKLNGFEFQGRQLRPQTARKNTANPFLNFGLKFPWNCNVAKMYALLQIKRSERHAERSGIKEK
ncbi:hypothetical protein HDU84_006695 [Entophlyctis sp. JEL0112]|nr:hypothetical protein HDU84_006695 [Entophlyctis sp. JEL0112]